MVATEDSKSPVERYVWVRFPPCPLMVLKSSSRENPFGRIKPGVISLNVIIKKVAFVITAIYAQVT